MKKAIWVLIIVVVIALMGVSCTTSDQSTKSNKDSAIEAVKKNLTTEIVGSYKAVEYKNGYVVNFEDMAYWYVENGKVYNLNGFAMTYAENCETKYGISWGDLF